MMSRFTVVALVAVLVSPLSAAMAMGPTGGQASPPVKAYDEAVEAVKRDDYRGAIKLLTQVLAGEPRHADALNYMGYSHRKLGDFERAVRFYRRALAVDPDHRGANEYLGEAYLGLGDLPKAEERLARLIDICGRSCAETQELDRAIRAYRSGKPTGSSDARRW